MLKHQAESFKAIYIVYYLLRFFKAPIDPHGKLVFCHLLFSTWGKVASPISYSVGFTLDFQNAITRMDFSQWIWPQESHHSAPVPSPYWSPHKLAFCPHGEPEPPETFRDKLCILQLNAGVFSPGIDQRLFWWIKLCNENSSTCRKRKRRFMPPLWHTCCSFEAYSMFLFICWWFIRVVI